jgi:hypothetical protein
VVEDLERLVGEIDGMAFVDEHVIRDRRAHDGGQFGWSGAPRHGRCQHPLGAVSTSGIDETPVPTIEPRGGYGGVERRQGEAGRVAPGITRDEGESVDQSQGPVAGVEDRKDVGHGGEHGQARSPALLAITDSELHPGTDHRRRAFVGAENLEQSEDGLGRDQRESVLQPVSETDHVVSSRISAGPNDHEDIIAIQFDLVSADVVSKGVQGPPGLQIEASVVPVTREESVLDGPSMERESQVRATVIEGIGIAIGPEDTDRLGVHLSGQTSTGSKLVDRTDSGSLHGPPLYDGPTTYQP